MKNFFYRVKAGLFLLSTLVLSYRAAAQVTVVKISTGYIKGIKEDQGIVFKGIPYAKPPVGALRFMPALPAAAWADTLLCQKFGSQASQSGGEQKALKGDEDCLTLNVYTPAAAPRSKLPVLVWIHGGAMVGGSGMGTNGHAFADQDSIITITINYRLGVFGFMYLGDVSRAYSASGNNGLLDCVMALKWIRQNTGAFGGDASRVTVIGESAGAKLASTLLLTPQAKGYFSQMILESGAVQCVRDTVTAKAIRQRLMDELQLTSAAGLLHISAEKLIAAQNKVCNGAQGTNYFGPVNDGVVINSDPYAYVRKNKNAQVRFLIGTNKYESRLFMNADKRLYHPDDVVLKAWFGNNYNYVLQAWQAQTKHTGGDTAAYITLTQYMYQMHSYRLASVLAGTGSPVWMYRYDYSRDGAGATHGDELQFVWFMPQHHSFNDTELQLGSSMHQAWVSFIKGKTPVIDHKQWPLYKPGDNSVMVFDHTAGPVKLKAVYNDQAYPTAGFVADK